MSAEPQSCYYEERFSRLEQDVAELKARMEVKKEDIHDINKELLNERQQQIELIEKVTEVTVLLKASQEQREANNKKFDDIEDKVDQLQTELTETKEQLTDLIASQRSFRNVVIVGVPMAIGIIGLIFHFI
jgi:chromosome segregation ATPase